MNKKDIENYFLNCKEEMVLDICELIKIDSVKSESKKSMPFGKKNAAVLKLATSQAISKGFKVKNYDNYVIAVDLNDKPVELDILNHLDVVPANEKEWTITKPFEPIVKDGKIFGRGSSDNKGPMVAVLYAMKAIKDLEIPLRCGVRLILGTDEESGSSDIKYYYSKEKEAKMTFSPDADFPLINSEKGGYHGGFYGDIKDSDSCVVSFEGGSRVNMVPSNAKVKFKGIDLDEIKRCCNLVNNKDKKVAFSFTEELDDITVEALGCASHGAEPEKGNNAITALLYVIEQIDCECRVFKELAKMFPHGEFYGKAVGIEMEDAKTGKLTLGLNVLKYSDGKIEGKIDCRVPLCATNENVVDVLRDKFTSLGINLERENFVKAHYVSPDEDFVKKLLKCYEQYTGEKGYCISTGGKTYAHNIKNGVAFGCTFPGVDNNMHGADEFVIIDDLIKSAMIFTQVIIDLCS